MGIWQVNAWELIKIGGPIMVPLGLCSILMFAIVIDRLIYFASIHTNTSRFKKRVFDLVRKNDMREAIELCEKNRSPVAKIMKAGLIKFGAPNEEIKESIEDTSLYVVPKLEQKIRAIATIAHIAPLLGLLGTVTGLASSFHTIQERATSLNPVTPGDLAGGIWEALLTTVAGLIIGIIAFVMYDYLLSRVNQFVLSMEHSATELLEFFSQLSHVSSLEKGGQES